MAGTGIVWMDAGSGVPAALIRRLETSMTNEEFSGLKVGDIVRGKSSGDTFVVTAHYGDRVTAVRTADLTHPSEWDLVWDGPRPSSVTLGSGSKTE
jgi:hypothetical protein